MRNLLRQCHRGSVWHAHCGLDLLYNIKQIAYIRFRICGYLAILLLHHCVSLVLLDNGRLRLHSTWTLIAYTCTVFIKIDAHALIDAHPLHQQALGTKNGWNWWIFCQKCMDWWWTVLIFAIVLLSDDAFEVKFWPYHPVSTLCLAHVQWAYIWMDMVHLLASVHYIQLIKSSCHGRQKKLSQHSHWPHEIPIPIQPHEIR